MYITKILAVFLSILFSPIFSEALEHAPETFANKTRINRDIIHGIELLYDQEFDQAEGLFQKVIEEYPDDPIGFFYKAMVTWSRLAAGFWSDEVVRQFSERIDIAISVSKRRIEKKKADSLTYFYLGGALGFKGRFRLMQHRWLSSFFLARDAIKALKTCQNLDPQNKEVLFGLGMFDYYTARFSGILRFLSYFLLRKTDKQTGLKRLHAAAREAIYTEIEAKSLLLHIYLFLESDFPKALPLAEELADRFKKSHGYKYLLGVIYIRLGLDSKYRDIVAQLREGNQDEASWRSGFTRRNRALYLEASYYLFHGQYDMARSKLSLILSDPDPIRDPFMIAWPLLKIGMSYDLEGEREEALEYYERILEMKNGAGAQFLAQKYHYDPIEEEDPFLGY